MIVITLLTVLLQLCICQLDPYKCTIDNRSLQNVWEQKIIEDLLMCNYESKNPPPSNTTSPLLVTVRFSLKYFKLNSAEQQFSAFTWTHLTWIDPRLAWDTTTYDGLDKVYVKSYRIWTPRLRLYNLVGDYDEIEYTFFYGDCRIESSGHVFCTLQVTYRAACSTDLQNWPYDSQKCQLIFGPMSVKEFGAANPNILLDFGEKAMSMIASEYGTEWDIMDYKQEEDQNVPRQLTMTFTLERHAEVLAAFMIYPSIILSVLSLSILFLDISRKRLFLLCFSLMCHYDFLSELSEHIPAHNMTSPSLLYFFRGSVVMTTISLMLTYVFSVVFISERKVPDFVVNINNFVYNSYAKFVIWPRWDVIRKVNKEFIMICNIANVIWILVTFVVYLVMYFGFIPTFAKMVSNIPPKKYIFA